MPRIRAAADAIRSLLHRYAACIDAADVEGVAGLFANGAISAPGIREPASGLRFDLRATRGEG